MGLAQKERTGTGHTNIGQQLIRAKGNITFLSSTVKHLNDLLEQVSKISMLMSFKLADMVNI